LIKRVAELGNLSDRNCEATSGRHRAVIARLSPTQVTTLAEGYLAGATVCMNWPTASVSIAPPCPSTCTAEASPCAAGDWTTTAWITPCDSTSEDGRWPESAPNWGLTVAPPGPLFGREASACVTHTAATGDP
jgi:hypothetical protein